MLINSNQVVENIKTKNYSHTVRPDGSYEVLDPNGYKFVIMPSDNDASIVIGVSLFCSNIETSVNYWSNVLKSKLEPNKTETNVSFSFDQSQFRLHLVLSSEKIYHAQAFGRIAFSCPTDQLLPLQAVIDQLKLTILTRFIELKTPGKADVCVVILADPDGHEICWVGDEGFRDLSRFDPQARSLLDQAVLSDKSDEWHEKKNKK